MSVERPRLRADLHLHSYHSGHAAHFRFLRTRDCYSDPDEVYRTAKARGMDLVTITDHDRIDGCLEFLDRHPDADDFFMSEEIECWFPGRRLRVHIAAYGIDERIHAEVHRLRANVHDVVAYLRQQGVFFSLNHLFFFFQQQMSLEDYLTAVLPLCPGIEVRNGTMLRLHNAFVREIVRDARRHGGLRLTAVGGSDAHTLRGIGRTYTEAPARTRAEFLQCLRDGRTRVGGQHGGTLRVAAEIYGVIGRYRASLVGVGRQELSAARRAVGIAWSVSSLPIEFTPLLVATIEKSGEARRMRAFRDAWHAARQSGVQRLERRVDVAPSMDAAEPS